VLSGLGGGTIGGIRRRQGVGKDCGVWVKTAGRAPHAAGIRNEGRGWLRTSGGCRQTMSDIR